MPFLMNTRPLIARLCLVLLLLPLSAEAQEEEQEQPITLKEIWSDYAFMARPAESLQWMADDAYYSELLQGSLIKHRVSEKGEADTLLHPEDLTPEGEEKPIQASSYRFGPNEEHILFFTDRQSIYRRSYTAIIYLYDFEAEQLMPLHEGERIAYPTFSPDGQKVAYTHENNLYYHDLAQDKRVQVTSDGKRNHIINGSTDWVYEEEFAFTKAFFWSPDSRQLAFMRFDEAHVKLFHMTKFDDLYPDDYTFKYPKAGEQNAWVSVLHYDLPSGETRTMLNGQDKDQYIPRMEWTTEPDKLAIYVMNRHQSKVEVRLATPGGGGMQTLLTETADTYLSEVDDKSLIFLEDGKHFLWQSERDGYNHLYLYNMDGSLERQLTEGEWEVTDVYGVDDDAGVVYFQSTAVSPLERHLHSVKLNGNKLKKLTDEEGWHSADFSSEYSYFIHSHSNTSLPGQHVLRKTGGKAVRMLQDNRRAKKNIEKHAISDKEFFSFQAQTGPELNGWMIKPPDFDPEKTYPVLMYVYGGPGAQTVEKTYDNFNYFWFQMLSQKGYIVVSVDGRGTGGRGAKFKKTTYMELGKYETEDQIAAANYLASLDYVDPDRIGIWGWSFGGYLSTLCITKGAETFSTAIAVAPVTNWRFYDTIYTERFMRTPQENPEGYDDNSPINHAEKLEGNYLMIHGTADDNVHFQNSVEMTNALVKAGKDFEVFYYPDRNHSIFGGNTRLHLYRLMTDFVQENL